MRDCSVAATNSSQLLDRLVLNQLQIRLPNDNAI